MRKMDGFMHGVNLGGWLSQFDRYDTAHFEGFITEKDFADIAALGLDHVRIPVDYVVLEEEDGTPKEDGYRYLDRCAAWCGRYHLSMIIDLHKTYGYSFDPLDDTDKTAFFRDAALQERFFILWERIADRYGKNSDCVAFELLNEIISPSIEEEWNGIAVKAIQRIRSKAPASWIIFGGVMYNAVVSVPHLAETDDPKVAYTFHCYEPLAFTHQGAYWVKGMPSDFRIDYPDSISHYRDVTHTVSPDLAGAIYDDAYSDLSDLSPEFFERLFAPALETAAARNIPLYCGEYGVIDLADDVSRINWVKDICSIFDKYGIGRSYWNYREKDFGIVNMKDARRKELVSYL